MRPVVRTAAAVARTRPLWIDVLCPRRALDLGVLRERQRIFDIDTEIAHRAFDLGVAKQDLDSPKVASCLLDDGSFRPARRMRAVSSFRRPIAVTHSLTRRAYCRVLRWVE